jgi:hypothetical protein
VQDGTPEVELIVKLAQFGMADEQVVPSLLRVYPEAHVMHIVLFVQLLQPDKQAVQAPAATK